MSGADERDTLGAASPIPSVNRAGPNPHFGTHAGKKFLNDLFAPAHRRHEAATQSVVEHPLLPALLAHLHGGLVALDLPAPQHVLADTLLLRLERGNLATQQVRQTAFADRHAEHALQHN